MLTASISPVDPNRTSTAAAPHPLPMWSAFATVVPPLIGDGEPSARPLPAVGTGGVPFLDYQARLFGSFISLIRRLGLPIHLQAE